MRIIISRRVFTVAEEYEGLVWMLSSDHVITFPRDNCQMNPCTLCADME